MKSRPTLTLIAAISKDGFISQGQGVPWNLPRDKAHFRRVTAGQWLLLGRRTYEEMLGWFRDHHPLVLTRDPNFVPSVGKAVSSVGEALQVAGEQGARELFICGGSGAYAAAMPLADRLLLTHVDLILGAGVPFPDFQAGDWHQAGCETFPADAENPHAMVIAAYGRLQYRVPA